MAHGNERTGALAAAAKLQWPSANVPMRPNGHREDKNMDASKLHAVHRKRFCHSQSFSYIADDWSWFSKMILTEDKNDPVQPEELNRALEKSIADDCKNRDVSVSQHALALVSLANSAPSSPTPGTSSTSAFAESTPKSSVESPYSTQKASSSRSSSPSARRFPCPTCQKRFTRRAGVQRHLRMHTGERPYKCDVCSRAFAELGALKRHKRVHTGERPFNCHLCKNAFAEAGSLKRHLRTHTGERPFKCTICLKGFSRPHIRTKHMLSHKKKGEKLMVSATEAVPVQRLKF